MNRPVITPNAAIDAVTMTAARSTFENIIFAAPGTDSQTADVNIAAQYCALLNTYHVGSGSSTNKVSIVTITADGDDCLIDGYSNSIMQLLLLLVAGYRLKVQLPI